MIARFNPNDDGGFLIMEPAEDGEFVFYEDHAEIMKIMQSSIDFWRNTCKKLGSKYDNR